MRPTEPFRREHEELLAANAPFGFRPGVIGDELAEVLLGKGPWSSSGIRSPAR